MKITLIELIRKYYKELNYMGTNYGKKNKQYIQIENKNFAETLIKKYDNLDLICTYGKYFITLK